MFGYVENRKIVHGIYIDCTVSGIIVASQMYQLQKTLYNLQWSLVRVWSSPRQNKLSKKKIPMARKIAHNLCLHHFPGRWRGLRLYDYNRQSFLGIIFTASKMVNILKRNSSSASWLDYTLLVQCIPCRRGNFRRINSWIIKIYSFLFNTTSIAEGAKMLSKVGVEIIHEPRPFFL